MGGKGAYQAEHSGFAVQGILRVVTSHWCPEGSPGIRQSIPRFTDLGILIDSGLEVTSVATLVVLAEYGVGHRSIRQSVASCESVLCIRVFFDTQVYSLYSAV